MHGQHVIPEKKEVACRRRNEDAGNANAKSGATRADRTDERRKDKIKNSRLYSKTRLIHKQQKQQSTSNKGAAAECMNARSEAWIDALLLQHREIIRLPLKAIDLGAEISEDMCRW